jgi:SAM-dependent methyltransferase
MWAVNATEAVGFDKEARSVEKAKWYRQRAYDFVNKEVPMVLQFCSQIYREEFLAWYNSKVSKEIRDGILPDFKQGDISIGIDWKSDYFDLVYSRYVMDKIEESKRLTALQEMVRITKVGGKIVIVAPENAIPQKSKLKTLNITQLETVGKEKLGKLECSSDNLRGVILVKC